MHIVDLHLMKKMPGEVWSQLIKGYHHSEHLYPPIHPLTHLYLPNLAPLISTQLLTGYG